MDNNFRQKLMKYMTGNFSCQEVAELVTEYLEGSMSLSERMRFQMHLGMCFACRNYLRQMKYTVATLQQLPPDPVPPAVKDELMKRFRDWKKEKEQPSGHPEIE